MPLKAFRAKLTNSQADVDAMLALGRSIISENYTNPNKDTLSQKLTEFISTWANLLMSWQNWSDELHATGEQSRNLSDQFTELQHVYEAVSPVFKELFPAKVSMETLEADLKQLQVNIHMYTYMYMHVYVLYCRVVILVKYKNL